MEQRTKRRRWTALFLALVMLVSLLPLNVLAESDDIIVQEEAENAEEEQEDKADAMESPEGGDFLMPEDALEDIPAETSPQEDGTQEPPQSEEVPEESQSEEAPEELPEELPTTEAEPEQIADGPEVEEVPPDEEYAVGEEETDESAEEQPEEQPESLAVRDALWQSDHAYVLMQGPAPLWRSADVTQGALYEIAACNSVLLATEVVEQDAGDMVRAWLMTEEYEVLCGYVSIEVLDAYALTDEEAEALAGQLWAWPVETEAGTRTVFVIEGEKVQDNFSEQEETPLWDAPDEVIVSEQWDSFLSDYADESAEAVWVAQPGDYIAVTTDTRAYLCVDETIDDEYGYDGDDYAGHFVNDAVLRVVSVAQDGWGRDWYEAEYEFGEALDNGKYLWTDVGTIFVLASETQPTDVQALTITDHAYREAPPQIALFSMSTTGMDGFSLRSCSQSTPYVYAGQTDVYATSGHDSEYPQIASLPGHGTIYATPHYINNCVVYCLEHTMPGPNANDGDGGRHPTGPYTIVDLDTYERTPGASGYIFKTETMHALAWVLRHTVPFMELARSDANNTVWSRVAGQFAMREVIKEMEGEFYVREYWIMEDFVRQAGQAPAVYLEYARWLAENGIAYGRMSGNITASGKSMQPSGSGYVATVTLTTDADRMRISRDVGELTGNSGGSDWQYYYLYSGDTISVASASASLSFTVESLPSSDDEANFLVGIPSVEIQKVLIPQDGDPVPMKAARLSFEVPMGAVSVTKKGNSGTLLPGAVFELVSSAGSVLATQTTGSDGMTTFTNVQPGTYTVREKSAPEGYLLSANAAQSVNVAAGNTSAVTFANDIIRGKIRIQKTDELTGKALAGATFTITRLSAPPAHNGAGVGQVAATITTDANGVAETGLLDWGRYQVRETGVPQFYKDKSFSAEVSVTQSGQTVTLDVTNEPIAGWIQLTKTDRLDGTPIAGVQFDIYENDEYGNALAGTMTTDASGVATSPALRKGSYLVREHGTPTGYCADSIELSAEVRPTETTSITATNQPIQGKIRIVKTDELTGEALAGAEFTVTRVSGLPSHNGAGNAEVVAVIRTDAEGIAETPLLTWGEYQITETGVPEHFVDNRFTANVVIDKENLETYTVDVTNEPTKGWLRLVKTDRLDGTPIAGVQFDIYYADEYGDGLAATMVTGADGVAKSIPLRKGHYIVREHADPTGYVSELVELEADVRPDETTNLTATNQPIQGRIRIVKTDELTGEALAGAEFTVTRVSGLPSHGGAGDGEVVAVLVTDAEGIAETPLLTWGEYQVKETGVPEHFVDNRFSVNVVIDKENLETYTVDVTNEPTKGWLRLVKTDRLDGTPIAGVQFDVYYADEYGDGLAATMVTGSDGVAKSIPLRKGHYFVREYADPTGYVTELVELEADVRSDETTNLTATNQPIQGRIRIVKTDELTGEALAGAEFTVTRVSGLPSHSVAGNAEVVAVITTDAEGIAETPLLTWGEYQIKETGVPEHFVDNRFTANVVIDKENLETYTVDVTNEPTKGWLRLVKTDRLDGTPIAGVQFDVYYADEYGDGLAATMVTGSDGVAKSIPLRKGHYIVREHADPTGYVTELVELEADVHPDETTHLTATNQPIQGRIRIVKTDELTGEALAGAEFTVTRVSGLPSHNGVGNAEVVAVITTDAEGIAETPLLTWGEYQVKETGVPEHFVDNRFTANVVIDKENLETYTVDVTNEPTKGFIQLTKTDRQNGNPIEGVTFDIFYNDQYGEGLAATMVTGADGVATSPALRKGRYIVRERGETAGYVFEEVTLPATVHSDETTTLAAANRHVTVRLKLYKRDADEYDGDDPNMSEAMPVLLQLPEPAYIAEPVTRGDGRLTGAVFRVLAGEDILDRQGNVVYAQGDTVVDSIQTAGEDACAVTDELWPGLYEIVELAPPEGYAPSGEHFFVDARSAAQQSRTVIVTYEGLKTNRITMGAQAIVKVLGDRAQDSDPKRVEKPEPGAEFQVYLRSAGSYENAREMERDMLVTDENGYAMTKPLPYGIYVLRQIKGAEGYEIKGPIEFRIDGTESLTNPPVLTLNDKPILYRLRFIKTDRETGREITLSNASFRLKDADGNTVVQKVYYPKEQEIDTFVTDDTGSVTLPETVTWGAYTVEEVRAPEGYLIRDEAVSIFVGRDGDTADEVYALDFVIEDAPVKGRIVLDKVGQQLTGFEAVTDSFGNVCQRSVFEDRPLAGAVFEVRAAEDIIGRDGTVWFKAGEVADTITTTGSGMDSSRELPLGRYVVVEVDAPDGYVFSEKEYEAILTAQDEKTPVVEVHVKALNAYMLCDITMKKEKEELQTVTDGSFVRQEFVNTPGEGFVFGLYSAEDIRMGDVVLMADTLVATGVTDAHGDLVFAGQFPHGEYLIRELAAPKGWKLSAQTYPISLKPENAVANIIRAELPEAVHNELVYGTITLTKTDITGKETLPGALIEVRDAQENVVYRAYTDEHGEIPDIPVTPGRYTFRELLAPEGYALSEAVMSFEVDERGQVTGDHVIRDDYTRVCIRKQDENGEPLHGVEFGLFAENGVQVQTALTDESGLAMFERIPYGEYDIRETKPLPGYVKNEHAQRVILDGHFVNPTEPVATLINRHMQVRCIKVDTSGQRLAGVEFVLINANTDEIVEVVTSDGDGVFTFRRLDYGDWIIRESRAPEGFSRMKDVVLHVDEGWTEPEPITCVNIPNHYEFMKTDNRGEPLAGARFALETEDGTFIRDDLISGEDGIVHVTGLKPGRYVIREVEPAEGFALTEETLTVTIDADYVLPKKLRRLKNYPEDYSILQTGVDFLLTPLGWAGIGLIGIGIAVGVICRMSGRRKRCKPKGKA